MAKLRLSALFRDPTKFILGIDFTASSLRLVQARRRNESLDIIRVGQSTVPPGIVNRGEIVHRRAMAKLLQASIKEHHLANIANTAVYAAISEHRTFVKSIKLSTTSGLDEAVRWEASQHIPYDLADLALDWQAVSQNSQQVIVAAAPQAIVDSYTTAMETAGLVPFRIEPSSISLLRFHSEQTKTGTSMILSLGEVESVAVVVSEGDLLFSALLPITSGHLEQAIQEHFQVEHKEAKMAREVLGFSRSRASGLVAKVLAGQIDALTKHIRSVEAFLVEHFEGIPALSKFILSGAGGETAGLDNELIVRLKRPVQKASRPLRLNFSKHRQLLEREFPRFNIVLGLIMAPPV